MALNLEQANAGTFNLVKTTLAAGTTTPAKIKTTTAAQVVIDGVFAPVQTTPGEYVLAAPTGFALVNLATGNKCAFGVWLASDGQTITETQGVAVSVGSNAEKAPPPPNPGGGRAMIGVFTVYNNSGSPWIPGTTATTNTATIVTTFFDMFSLPSSGF